MKVKKSMDANELIGITLGTCTLERVIGRGGMGAVFLAQQSRPLRTVAVKVLIPSNTFDPDQQRIFLARFRREADTIAKLDHRNILPVYEYDEAVVDQEQLAYLVMPYIRGGTLRERLDEMRRTGSYFDLKTVASYLSQVADALSYAHGLGIVHRDVKPANLLFHQDGRLLLSDFGIAHLRAMPGMPDMSTLTGVGSFLGTAEYASPEQINGDKVDYRSDIYSLGTILYEMLTDSVPFTGPNPFMVMTRKLNDPVPSIRASRSELSPAMDAIVMKALARNPDDRYQTATMLAADFRSAVAAASGTRLRLGGDANSSDLTIAEQPWGSSSPAAAPAPSAANTGPAAQQVASSPPGGAAWQQPPPPWQWPQSQAQVQPTPAGGNNGASAQAGKRTTGPDALTYRQGHRLLFYGGLLITLLLQWLVFSYLTRTSNNGTEALAMLGILVGGSINLLLLAATCFTAVIRDRRTGRFVIPSLINALIAPLISGLFIDFGAQHTGIGYHIVAYVILLGSNLYALRQLAHVDARREQIRVANVSWGPAIVGALTGLLPLTIILTFALTTLVSRAPVPVNGAPMLALLRALFIVFVGIPTPGAVMAVKLSQQMRFATLLRSSAIAGMLMCVGAMLLVVLLGIIFSSNHSQVLEGLRQTWLVLLIMAAILAVLGALRGMLDSWVYQKIRGNAKANP